MPARKKKKYINLIPSEGFQSSVIGRMLKWALTSFRVMVIVCEMIVMGAFLSRFWLDAKNSDLTEEINIARAQVEAYEPVETEFRTLQKRLLIANDLYAEDKLTALTKTLSQYIPNDVILVSVTSSEEIVQIKSASLSEQSILQFIANLEATSLFEEIKLGQISTTVDNKSFIAFTLTTKLK